MILAGGRGDRMRPLTDSLPKTLLPVAGEPFASHQLAWLAREGVKRVVYCIGYRGDMVRLHVGDGARWGLAVEYVDEGEKLRGTAGALRLALDQGVLASRFLVLYGDSYLPIALEPVWSAFEASGRPGLMTVLRNEGRWDRSNAVVEDGVVSLYDKAPGETPRAMQWIDYGLSALQQSVVETRIPASGFAALTDLFHELSLDGELAAYEVQERFFEIGSAPGLAELERHLARG